MPASSAKHSKPARTPSAGSKGAPKDLARPGKDLEVARRVLGIEAEALASLSRALGPGFVAAVGILMAVKGRIIVSGMGKSGHIARKMAATFASTGAPSHFVHPGEASHGDLGMIAPGDAVVLLSNSGETRELGDLIAHTRRYDIPLIGIASRERSTLIAKSDAGLVLPSAPEACPMGLAPTTSTTMMLALGDALAVALMERKGFSQNDYRVLHPGGALGLQLKRVADIMHAGSEIPLVTPKAGMPQVLIEMTGKRFGCAGVVDAGGSLIGIITDGDLRRHLTKDLLAMEAEAVMTKNPKTVRADALVQEALAQMTARPPHVTALFVMPARGGKAGDAAKPVGILHIHDCLRAGN